MYCPAMTEIVLFHHELGLTEGIRDFAAQLRLRGFAVRTPDLFEGRLFPNSAEGLAYVQDLGSATVLSRAELASAEVYAPTVYGGFGFGVGSAIHLLTRKSALGGLLFHGFVSPGEGSAPLPDVPIHVYAMDSDPAFYGQSLRDTRESGEKIPNLALHFYPGKKHLFIDSSSPDFDELTTDKVLDEVERSIRALRQIP